MTTETLHRFAHQESELSATQNRFWAVEQGAEIGVMNTAQLVTLHGVLDEAALCAAAAAVLARHPLLATTFRNEGGRLRPRAVDRVSPDFTSFDLSGPPAECAQRLTELVDEEARRSFDLTRPPLWRLILVRQGDSSWNLLSVLHPIAGDRASGWILLSELAALYSAADDDVRPLPFAPCLAEHESRAQAWLQGNEAFNKPEGSRRRLAGVSNGLELPTDHPRLRLQCPRPRSVQLITPSKLDEALEYAAHLSGVTLLDLLLAAFAAYLFRITGQANLLFGMVHDGRSTGKADMVGPLERRLPVRFSVSPHTRLTDLAVAAANEIAEARADAGCPADCLRGALDLYTMSCQTPIFPAVFELESAHPRLQFSGLETEVSSLQTGGEPIDLLLRITVSSPLSICFEYDSGQFEQATIERFAGHWLRLLQATAAEPTKKVRDLPLLSSNEQHQILVDWNRTSTNYPRQSTVQELFEAQAARTPEAIAVSFESYHLTYAELNRRANQLAHYLQALGVGPEVPVAICVERSLEMVVGLLGIVKAGGAYVPLDPKYPAPRLNFILQDTGAKIVLTLERLLARVPGRTEKTICLDRDWQEIASQESSNPAYCVSADNLAYVIYTSGSTGLPKGSCIVHRSIVRLVRDTNFASFSPDQIFLQFAPLAFDASTLEIWGPLLNGGRLVVAPSGDLGSDELSALLRREGVTALWLTAGLFHQMVENSLDGFIGLRQFLAGGDVLSVSHFNRVVSTMPGIRLTNGYGPTENTTFTCCHVATEPVSQSRIPIGRPIANTQVYILDQEMCPVPVGVWGDLYAAGDGLARCYLGRPALTAERFLPNPFGEVGSRMYRTGDIARYLPDGAIDFGGRVDDQVKIGGFRIEPREIESVLTQHERVREVVVLARKDLPGGKRLVAYVVPESAQTDLVPELRSYLRRSLPPYMIPSVFVLLNALPLTSNGKINRRALPAPDLWHAKLDTAYGEPQNEFERQVADLWAKVLGVSHVGRDDDFFELGGNSLLAMWITVNITKTFGVRIPLRRFYERPTVAELARVVEELWKDSQNVS